MEGKYVIKEGAQATERKLNSEMAFVGGKNTVKNNSVSGLPFRLRCSDQINFLQVTGICISP